MTKKKLVLIAEENPVDESAWTDNDVEMNREDVSEDTQPAPEEKQPDTKCTDCKHLVVSQNVIFWPLMCYQNRSDIIKLWADEDGDPAKSALCVTEMLKEID